MQFVGFRLVLIAAATVGCAKDSGVQSKVTPLTIVATFPGFESGEETGDAQEQLSLTREETNATGSLLTAETTQTGATEAGTTSTITPSEVVSPITRLDESLSGAETVFTNKRVFRWFSYRITNGESLVKADSIEMDDPSVNEIPPIEISAALDDKLNLKLSYMQVDFLSKVDADGFCDKGSIGFVRTWDAVAERIVDDTGVIALDFMESGRSAVTMAALKINGDSLASQSLDSMKSTLLNEQTGFRLAEGICQVKNMYPNFKSTEKFLRVMAFSHPLKSVQLLHYDSVQKVRSMTEPGGWKALILGTRQPAVANELGVSAAFNADVSDKSTWSLQPASFSDVLPPELSPRLPMELHLPQTHHKTQPVVVGKNLLFDVKGSLSDQVKVEVLALSNRAAACNSGTVLASAQDYTDGAAEFSVLLGQGAGRYYLRIRTQSPDGTQVCSTSPLAFDVPAFIPDRGESKIAAGENHSCAISAGRVFCWGDNSAGQVNGVNGSSEPRILVPTEVVGVGTTAHAVFAGPMHTCAIVDDSESKQAVAKCWGSAFSAESSSLPFYELSSYASSTIVTSANHTCAVSIASDQTNDIDSHPPPLTCVGHASVTSPPVDLSSLLTALIPMGNKMQGVSLVLSNDSMCSLIPVSNDFQVICSLLTAGTIDTIKLTDSTQSQVNYESTGLKKLVGTETPTPVNVVLSVNDPAQFQMVSDGTQFYALHAGKVVTWSVQSGNTQVEPKAAAPEVQGSTSLYAGHGNVCAVKDGALLCWGGNSGGQFVQSARTQIPMSKPQSIPETKGTQAASLGGGHVCVIQALTGNLRCWGKNDTGQLGINRLAAEKENPMTLFNVVK